MGTESGAGRDPGPAELGIGLVPFCPLGRGFLTGEFKRAEEYPKGDFRRTDPRYQGENYDANVKAARMIRDIAAVKHAKPGQIAREPALSRKGRISRFKKCGEVEKKTKCRVEFDQIFSAHSRFLFACIRRS